MSVAHGGSGWVVRGRVGILITGYDNGGGKENGGNRMSTVLVISVFGVRVR